MVCFGLNLRIMACCSANYEIVRMYELLSWRLCWEAIALYSWVRNQF